jgi:hypothetical protein
MATPPPPLDNNALDHPVEVDAIVAAPQASTETGLVALELETRQVELAKAHLINQEFKEILEQRRAWGNKFFWVLLGWLVSVVLVVFFQGFQYQGFKLDNSVLIAFIGTTTADVLGIGYVIANFLFPKRP